MDEPKYPGIKVKLTEGDGNAFAILGEMRKAFKENDLLEQWEEFRAEATSGNYDHLLITCMKWVDVI
jgi:hypothetical protein